VTADEHCRITVVNGRRQVDLAVPAGAPITTYIDSVASLCAVSSNDMLPAAWSLGTVTEGPFPPERSLSELGILDGQILYLRDVIEDEHSDPVVRDVGERVAEVAEGALTRGWDAPGRTIAVTALGLGWLVGALVVVAFRSQASAGAVADIAVIAGLVLPSLAWVAAERRWPVPPHLQQGLALSAEPVLALAGLLITAPNWHSRSHAMQAFLTGTGLTEAGLTAAGVAAGALAGAFLAYVATPGVTTCAILFATGVAMMLSGVLAAARAGRAESATVVAVVMFGLLTAAPMTVSQIVTFAYRHARARFATGEERGDEDDAVVAAAVREGTALLVLWGCALAAVLVVVLVLMASSRSACAVAAAGCLGLALLLRGGAARLVAEVLPVGLAGATGLFTLLLFGPGHLGWPGWVAPFAAFGIPAGLLIYGFRRLFRPGPARGERPRWLTDLSSMLGGISVPLALAMSGALGHLAALGHHI
jgi:hypothetical protein